MPAEMPAEMLVEPPPCQHVQRSHELIERVMHEVRPGRALILGAGACREIPLMSLAQRFERIVLQDQDASALDIAVSRLAGAEVKATVRTEVRDLTGITEALIAGAEQRLQLAGSPAHAIELLIEMIDAARLTPEPPRPEWDLVIASCVGTQLHIRARDEITRRYEQRCGDAGVGAALAQSPVWTGAMRRLSRRLQASFIEHLLGLIARDGRIYLSDAVQAGGLANGLADRAEMLTAGALPLHGGQWPYVVAAPSLAAPGLLYNVHAIVMTRREV